MKFYFYILLITLLFILWSEYSITNIIIRQNSQGKRSFNLSSLLGFLADPFYKSTLWTEDTLDINYAFVLLYSVGIYYLF